MVFEHNFHRQYLPQAKEELFLKDFICLKKGNCLLLRQLLARSRTKQILRCSNQANELQLPRH